MITTFRGKKITGILSVLPENEYDFDEETAHFADIQTRRLKRIMGFGKRRSAKADTTTGDLCHYAMQYLLDNNLIQVEEVGAIIVSGLTPDYFIPHNSNILHGEFGFAKDVVCIDIPQGCCGFMIGLMEAAMLLEHISGKKVLVFTADVLNRKNYEDKIYAPSFGGDACSVTVVENKVEASDIFYSIHNDGTGREALIMHAGGWRMPRSAKTSIPVDTGEGDKKPYDALWMNGSMVFNFMQKEVPPMVDELLDYAGVTKDDIDVFLCHQPNKFMLQKLAQRMKVPFEKMPMNIVGTFGNSSGSTIPVNIAYNYGERMKSEQVKCCMAAFGSGLTWAGAVMELGNLDFCEMVTSNL
ncbi:MAG: ketoacyl-ACP synthase III [Schwartzia succinivorans]|uniref:3-oxoacyl-ACP synthase III family protein n=1 Tax=Schwartzia succinivorans TaxID=55507 RepID=UPI002355F671|nr:ketoacyl-ACP synthase III [Schwartzia succinivorans]MBE6096533.1 ketoacyl-ACP synthase III [Schwartzia succinivorans]